MAFWKDWLSKITNIIRIVLSVTILISLQNSFDWTHKSLKCIMIQVHESNISNCDNICLSGDVLYQSKFSKVITFLILIDYFFDSLIIKLCRLELTFFNHIEIVSFFSLFDNVFSCFIFNISDTIAQMYTLIRIH